MIYIILAMLLYSVGILFGAAAARHSDTNVATAIINTMSTVLPLIVVAYAASKKTLVSSDKFGITMAILGGLGVGLFVMAINKAFSVNKVGIVTPMVFGGAVFLSTIASYFIFKEKISALQGVGLVLLATGFIVITYARATTK